MHVLTEGHYFIPIPAGIHNQVTGFIATMKIFHTQLGHNQRTVEIPFMAGLKPSFAAAPWIPPPPPTHTHNHPHTPLPSNIYSKPPEFNWERELWLHFNRNWSKIICLVAMMIFVNIHWTLLSFSPGIQHMLIPNWSWLHHGITGPLWGESTIPLTQGL